MGCNRGIDARALKKYEEGVYTLTVFRPRMYPVDVPLHHHDTKRPVPRPPYQTKVSCMNAQHASMHSLVHGWTRIGSSRPVPIRKSDTLLNN